MDMNTGLKGRLARLLDRCVTDSDRWFASMEPWQPPGPRRIYPSKTLRTLHLAGLVQFQAGIHLLREPLLAYGVEHHIRALIELTTHAAWIRDVGGLNAPMNPRARAVCVELGMANALRREVEFESTKLGIIFPPKTLQNSRYLATLYTRMHAKDNCACGGKGRQHNDPQKTLIDLMHAPQAQRLGGAILLYGLWKTYSRSVHFPRLEHLAADVPGGTAWTAASVPDRALWVQNLLLPHAFLATSAAFASWMTGQEIGLSSWQIQDEAQLLASAG
jgi:hypothetical protein